MFVTWSYPTVNATQWLQKVIEYVTSHNLQPHQLPLHHRDSTPFDGFNQMNTNDRMADRKGCKIGLVSIPERTPRSINQRITP